MGYEVSASTRKKLEALISRGNRTGAPSTDGNGTGRYDTHVKITGVKSGNYYPCKPTYFDPVAATWVELDTQRAIAANGGTLKLGRRYRAICYGKTSTFLLFACDDDDDAIEGGTCDDLTGDGLEVDDDSDSDSDSGDCKIKVKAGCGNKVDGDGVAVDMTQANSINFMAAGAGTLSGGPCNITFSQPLKTYRLVTNACGVVIGMELLSSQTYSSTVSTDCCKCEDSDSDSDSDSTSTDCGQAIWWWDAESDTWILAANWCGPGLTPIQLDRQVYFAYEYLTTSCCPDPDDSSSGPPTDLCTGWYCCSKTGQVVYVANCAEFAALPDCGEDSTSGGGCKMFTAPGYYCTNNTPDPCIMLLDCTDPDIVIYSGPYMDADCGGIC